MVRLRLHLAPALAWLTMTPAIGPRQDCLLAAVRRRAHASIHRGPAQAVERRVGGPRELLDGFFSVGLIARLRRHVAEDVSAFREDDTGCGAPSCYSVGVSRALR